MQVNISEEKPVRQERQQELNKIMLKSKRVSRHTGITKHLTTSVDRPRLAVFRSNQHIYAQIIDDINHVTLVSESDLVAKDGAKRNGTKKEKAVNVGEAIAKKALDKKIKKVVFDRGGFKFHGRIASVAEGARKGGLEF